MRDEQVSSDSTRLILGWGKVHGGCPGLAEVGIAGRAHLLWRTADGFRLQAHDRQVCHTLPAGLGSCSCGDGTRRAGNRPGGCRHMAALRALAAAGKLD